MLIGRKFSSKLSKMVWSPDHKAFSLEIYDDPADPEKARYEMVPPSKLSGFVKHRKWEEGCWDPFEEKLLLGLHAAHLNSFLRACGGGCAIFLCRRVFSSIISCLV